MGGTKNWSFAVSSSPDGTHTFNPPYTRITVFGGEPKKQGAASVDAAVKDNLSNVLTRTSGGDNSGFV